MFNKKYKHAKFIKKVGIAQTYQNIIITGLYWSGMNIILVHNLSVLLLNQYHHAW